MRVQNCSVCGHAMKGQGYATQVYRHEGAVVTITGIPAVRICSCCENAVLEWEVAQQVEDLVKSFFAWKESHSLPGPVVTVVFPAAQELEV